MNKRGRGLPAACCTGILCARVLLFQGAKRIRIDEDQGNDAMLLFSYEQGR
jgi:hypothetical protein